MTDLQKMIRQPTSEADAFAWWRAALAGQTPQITTEPQCGFFRRRLIRGGPWVPARVWLDREIDEETGELIVDEIMRCEVNGETRDADDQWTYLAGHPIAESEFDYMMRLGRWARAHSPDQPEADPNKPVDWLNGPINF